MFLERKGEHSWFLCERSLFLPELCECEPLPAKAEAARLMGHEQKRQSASSVFYEKKMEEKAASVDMLHRACKGEAQASVLQDCIFSLD